MKLINNPFSDQFQITENPFSDQFQITETRPTLQALGCKTITRTVSPASCRYKRCLQSGDIPGRLQSRTLQSVIRTTSSHGPRQLNNQSNNEAHPFDSDPPPHFRHWDAKQLGTSLKFQRCHKPRKIPGRLQSRTLQSVRRAWMCRFAWDVSPGMCRHVPCTPTCTPTTT